MDDRINFIADNARASISNYCINICEAKCCRSGKLLLQGANEVKAVLHTQEHAQNLINKGILTPGNNSGNFHLNLEKTNCLNLIQNKCSIHKDPLKPKICDDYPLFFVKGYVLASPACNAVRDGLLDSYIEKLIKLGIKKA